MMDYDQNNFFAIVLPCVNINGILEGLYANTESACVLGFIQNSNLTHQGKKGKDVKYEQFSIVESLKKTNENLLFFQYSPKN